MRYSIERILLILFVLGAISAVSSVLLWQQDANTSTDTKEMAIAEAPMEVAEATDDIETDIGSSTENVAEVVEENGAPLESRAPLTEERDPLETISVGQEEAPADAAGSALPIEDPQEATESTYAATTPESDLNELARGALVNILCISKTGGALRPISGSGIVVDSRGVILTNAHIAQYYLLRDYQVDDFIECTIRTGSPATATYRAEPLYISERWVNTNAEQIDSENPQGTGEYDYALLHITESLTGGALPTQFSAVSPLASSASIALGDSVLIAGYPAGFFGGATIQQNLYAATAFSTIREWYTFGSDTVDLVSTGGTILAQKGASGGAVLDERGALLGLVVTATSAETTSGRDLRASTLPYISRTLKAEAGYSLSELSERNIALEAHRFITTRAPSLTRALEAALE